MDTEELLEKVKNAVKENKDLAPLIGALVALLLSGNEDTQTKIVNGLVGAGLGYVLKEFIKE